MQTSGSEGHFLLPAPVMARARALPPVSSTASLLNIMAIPLGIAGFGGFWQALQGTVDAPKWPAEVLFAVAAILWVVLAANYLVRALGRPGSFGDDRRHPLYGPFAAYLPVTGILVAVHYEEYLRDTGRTAVVIFVAALAFLLAQLLGHWLVGNLALADVHPGYLLPTVAGPFVASVGLGFSGWPEAAKSAFGVGFFLWFIIGSMIFNRLFTGAELPDQLKPLLSVLVSAPAAGGVAWFVIARGRFDTVGYLLLGVTYLMLLTQVMIFFGYRKLKFTPTFWAFSFPVGASTNLTDRWLALEGFPGWRAWSWSISTVATVALIAVAAGTVAVQARSRRPSPTISQT